MDRYLKAHDDLQTVLRLYEGVLDGKTTLPLGRSGPVGGDAVATEGGRTETDMDEAFGGEDTFFGDNVSSIPSCVFVPSFAGAHRGLAVSHRSKLFDGLGCGKSGILVRSRYGSRRLWKTLLFGSSSCSKTVSNGFFFYGGGCCMRTTSFLFPQENALAYLLSTAYFLISCHFSRPRGV